MCVCIYGVISVLRTGGLPVQSCFTPNETVGLESKGSTFIDWFSFSSSSMVMTSFPDHVGRFLVTLYQV